MNPVERVTLRNCNEELVSVLDARHIAPLLYSKGYISEETMEEFYEQNGSRRNFCQKFLLSIVNSCPFGVFLDVLCFKNYEILAQRLKDVKDSQDDTAEIGALQRCQTSCNQGFGRVGFQNINDQGIENTYTSNQRLKDLNSYTDTTVHRIDDLKIYAETRDHTAGDIKSYANICCHKIKDLKGHGETTGSQTNDLKSSADTSVLRTEKLNGNTDTSGYRIEDMSRNSVCISHKINRIEDTKIDMGSNVKTLENKKSITDIHSQRTEDSICYKDINIIEDSKHDTDASDHCIENLKIDTSGLRLEDLKCYTDTSGHNAEDSTSHVHSCDYRLQCLNNCTETGGRKLENLKCIQESTANVIEGTNSYQDTNSDKRLENLKSGEDFGVQNLEAVMSFQETGTTGLKDSNFSNDLRSQRLQNLKYYQDSCVSRLNHRHGNQDTDKHAMEYSKSSFTTGHQGSLNSLNNSTPRPESFLDLRAKKWNNIECNNKNNISCQSSVSSEVSTNNTERVPAKQENSTLPKPVSRIAVRNTSHTRKLATLAHKLKTLSHNGNVEKFREISDALLNRFRNNKPQLDISVALKMKEADVAFTVLEAEASAKRVKYDVTLYESDIFKEMESVIPFTSNPTCSSMTYLARYGSAITMLETLDTGIAHLMYAKHHAQHIEPGKSTGMVYYIEVNLLSQKYEQNPVSELKERILKTAEEAISHFTHEDEDIRRDYQRMLMLKMAFCHLGIGLFCKLIENISNSLDDRKAAKSCLDFIERPENWAGMEKRRKMLFLVAKSELYRQERQCDLARCHLTEAQTLAQEGNWKTELSNIEILLKAIDNPESPEQDNEEIDIEDIINELLGDND